MTWTCRRAPDSAAAGFVAAPDKALAQIPRLIKDLFYARGMTSPDAMKRWLAPTLKDLKDPFVLRDMEKAVGRLVAARERQETVCIYADYDLDGTSACALFKTALENLGFERVEFYQPSRLTEGYGLHEAALRKLVLERKVSLFVTVDLGITAIHEAEVARELGVDLIITDHHLPKEQLPNAFAVVNPNRGDCDSHLGHLCGTGVAFYMALALKRALLESGAISAGFDPKSLLDCFTIGTVTDMVPLTEENRVLVKHGLLALAQTQRPGLRALLQALGLWGQPLTSQDVAIRFAPKLNALSRLELGIRPLDIYLAKTTAEAEKLVAEVLSCNQSRVALQKEAEALAMSELAANPPSRCIVLANQRFHQGVVGLVATRVSQTFALPSFVGAQKEDGVITGSARGPDGCDLLAAMDAAGDALLHFGGHAQAAGFELKASELPKFAERLRAHFEGAIATSEREWLYDSECTLDDLDESFMDWYDRLSPFGAKFPQGLFRLREVRIESARALKGGHLRLGLGPRPSIPAQEASRAAAGFKKESRSVAAIYFSPPSSVPSLERLTAAYDVEALVEPQWNWFRGSRTMQLLIHDLRVSDAADTSQSMASSHSVESY